MESNSRDRGARESATADVASDAPVVEIAPMIELSDGTHIPRIGLGTAPMNVEQTQDAVLSAIECGYRLFDTGAAYGNESGVSCGLRSSPLAREQAWVLSKLRGSDQGLGSTERGLHASLEQLGLDYVDVYLIHWPLPNQALYVDTWKELIKLKGEGLIKSIGTSNFLPEHLETLERETGVLPSINQIEVHPGFHQPELRDWHREHSIQTMAYSPLGRGTGLLDSEIVTALATRYGVSPAQIVLRWHIELGVIPVPRTSNPERQRQNFDVFAFALGPEDTRRLSEAFPQHRVGHDPRTHEEF